MDLRAFDRVAYQLVYFELMILGCTVHCRFRFSDCTVIHCVLPHYEDEQVSWTRTFPVRPD